MFNCESMLIGVLIIWFISDRHIGKTSGECRKFCTHGIQQQLLMFKSFCHRTRNIKMANKVMLRFTFQLENSRGESTETFYSEYRFNLTEASVQQCQPNLVS